MLKKKPSLSVPAPSTSLIPSLTSLLYLNNQPIQFLLTVKNSLEPSIPPPLHTKTPYSTFLYPLSSIIDVSLLIYVLPPLKTTSFSKSYAICATSF